MLKIVFTVINTLAYLASKKSFQHRHLHGRQGVAAGRQQQDDRLVAVGVGEGGLQIELRNL
jgi:hypothetical protein